MAKKLTTIAFDADDTLWQNETFFRLTEERFAELLSGFAEKPQLEDRLLIAERRNLRRYGFGVKSFVLSMIETAIEISDGKVAASVIGDLINAGKEMLAHPVHLLPHARETIENLSGRYQLLLITKGDLLDQQRKLDQSGLKSLFDTVEVVSDKTPSVYGEIFARHGDGAACSMMVGNSLHSDVIPVLKAGGWGVFVPHDLTWAYEESAPPRDHAKFHELADLSGLEALLLSV